MNRIKHTITASQDYIDPVIDELVNDLISLVETHENMFMLNKYNQYAEFSQVVEDKKQELLTAISERINRAYISTRT